MDKSMLNKNNETEQVTVNINKNVETEQPQDTPVVNISKEESQVTEQPNNANTVGGIDLDKVHEMENKATDAVEKGLGAVMGAVQGAFDSINQGINNTIDKVEGSGQGEQGQTQSQPNYNQYGQPQGQMNYNQYGQPNQTQYQQNNYQGQSMNQNKNTFQQGFIANPNRTDNITPDKLKLEPALAAIVSFFVSGLGQMLNGQLEKGLIILGCGLIIIPILAIITCGLGTLLAIPFAIFQIIDAYKCAQILQSGRPLGKYEYHLW